MIIHKKPSWRKVIYRPHRGSLVDSMAEAKEFSNVEGMKRHIVESWHGWIEAEDITISEERIEDSRIDWDGVYYVCVKRVADEDYIEKYGYPQCIGMCTYGLKTNEPCYRDGSKVNIGDLVLFESEKANLHELCEVVEIWEQENISPSDNIVLRSTFDKCDFSYRSYDVDFVVKRVGE